LPGDDRLRLYDQQRIRPPGPSLSQERPEEPINRAQWRPGPPPLQDSHLLAKGEDFESNVSSALQEDASGSNQGKDQWQHGLLVLP
jgi:hypothetical protein